MDRKTRVLVDTLRFPESPVWHDDRLWLSDFFARRVLQVDLNGNVQVVAELQDIPSGLGWTPDGRMLVASSRERQLYRLDGGTLVKAADLAGMVAAPCSHLVVDGQGRIYIGNMGYEFGNPQAVPQPGSLLLVTSQDGIRMAAEGLAFPNGMVITPDGSCLILAESHVARLTAFTIAPDGSLSNRRAWAQFEDKGNFGATPGQLTPDGICLDEEGAIWFASPNTRDVLRVKEGAEIVDRIPIDAIPLACTLGGPDRRTLFIAGTESLDPRDSKARGRIETLQVDVPGAGLP